MSTPGPARIAAQLTHQANNPASTVVQIKAQIANYKDIADNPPDKEWDVIYYCDFITAAINLNQANLWSDASIKADLVGRMSAFIPESIL